MERKMVGVGEGGKQELIFNGYRVLHFYKMKKILETDGGDSRKTM